MKYWYLKLVWFIFVGFFYYFFCYANVSVNFSVDPWQITWWVSSGLSLWTIEAGQTQQVLTWQFAGYFWVQDLKWSDTGWTTTVNCDWLYWPQWSIITWIYLKAWNSSPNLLLWTIWNVLINQNLINDYEPIEVSISYIHRPQWQNNWKINKYGDIPYIKVIIPPYTPPGNYSWTIYFDLQ